MRSTSAATVVVAALVLLSCNGNGDDENANYSQDNGPTATPAEATEAVSVESGFEPYGEDVTAVTYDEELVSTDAEVELDVTPAQDSTQFHLEVDDLEPNREYGAHVHTDPCGPHPEDSGPHYQDDVDPEQPSTNPDYANPSNEVWLDFTTDEDGDAESDAEVDWLVRSGEANSLVIHEEHTSHEPGVAGEAGDRLGCVNVAP